jgi:hypothetical protein
VPYTQFTVWHRVGYTTEAGNGLDLYSGGDRFETRSRHRLSWLRFFVAFLTLSRQTYLIQTTTAASQSHPTARRYKVLILKAQLNNPQKKNWLVSYNR